MFFTYESSQNKYANGVYNLKCNFDKSNLSLQRKLRKNMELHI